MAAKTQGVKGRAARQIQEAEVLTVVKGLNTESVSQSIVETQVEVQKVLADLSARVMERLQELETVDEAIRLKKAEFTQLHGMEAVATSLDDLEAQIKDQRRAWDEEQAAKKREFDEMRSERNKKWVREEEEYQYRLALEHRKLEDAHASSMAQQEKANREKQSDLEKSWAEREGELKKREQEFLELKAFKEQAPDMVKKAVNQEVAIATNSVKKEYETRMVLSNKDAETEKKLADQQIQALQLNLTKQQAQLDDLKAQLEQAHRDVKEISGKALDSASGRATTEALQRLLEKEPTSGKTAK